MKGPLIKLIAGGLSLLLAGPVLAGESKEDKLSSDQSQAQYTRKSMTYLGATVERGLSVPNDALQAAEKAIRAGIELKRFDYNAVDVSKFRSLDDFVTALRDYVRKRAHDRAAAEAEFDTRFKDARVYASDVDRIMNSAYFYTINVFVFRADPFTCPSDPKAAALQGCAPGVVGIKAVVNAKVPFYRANLLDEKAPPYTVIKTLQEMPGKGVAPYQPPPLPPVIPPGASSEQRRAIQAAYQQQMAEYNRRLPELRRKATLEAVTAASNSLAMWLSKSMKKIPDFQLKTPVTGALSDGVEFMLGEGVGLQLDDTYDVTEFDVAGAKKLIGYVKVRDIGTAKGTGEGSPSYAEKVKEKRTFVGGESLIEHPMVGINVGLHPIFEYLFADFPFDGDKVMAFGGGMYVDYDLAPTIGIPEFYLSLEGDYLYLGTIRSVQTSSGADASLGVVHAMIGIKKKWYINSLVVSLGLRGGISYFVIDDDSDDTLIGAGGDGVLGLEYYIMPEFSVYLNAAGRFFTNPLNLAGIDANFEMAANGSLGVRLGF